MTPAMPEPPVSDAVASTETTPPTVAPSAGAVSDPDGTVLSTRKFRTGLAPGLPDPSTATARSS
jgi:hypothetical protein